jgi:RHS repeat-associated protein
MGGLMDYKARFYSPYINHFTQPDTIVPDLLNPQTWNRYSYTQNNPLMFVDSSGHLAILPALLVAGVVITGWLVFAPPAYAPTSEVDFDNRVAIAEERTQTKIAHWIDENPVLYVAAATIVAYAGWKVAVEIFMLTAGENDKLPASKEPDRLAKGNRFHYEENMGPDQLEEMYPDTEFGFKKRGEKGADVEVIGGRHPSEYPDSTWEAENHYGDFKPNTKSSERNFDREINKGKLPPNTQPLPYDNKLFRLLREHFFKWK